MLLDNLKTYVEGQGVAWVDFCDTHRDELLRLLTDGDTAQLTAKVATTYPALSVGASAALDSAFLNGIADASGKANLVGGNLFSGSQLLEDNEFLVLLSDPNDLGRGYTVLGNAGETVQFGYNNAADEAYIWAFQSVPLKFGTAGADRGRFTADGRFAVNTLAPSAAAQMQIDSTTRGFLPPRMTTSQRLAIATPPAGLQVFDTTIGAPCVFDGTFWQVHTTATHLTLAGNFPVLSNVRSNVVDWAIPVVAGGTYHIRVLGQFQTTAGGTGGSIGFGPTIATGTYRGEFRGSVSAVSVATEVMVPITSNASFLTTAGVSAANVPHCISMDLIFVCTGSGSLLIAWGSETNGQTATLLAGSTLRYQRIA